MALDAPWVWPPFSRAMRNLFDQMAPGWEKQVGAAHVLPAIAGLSWLAGEGAIAASGPLVDAGCGTGLGTRAMAAAFPRRQVIGLDLSVEMLRIAAASPADSGEVGAGTACGAGAPPRYCAADASRLPFRHGSVALLMMMNVPPFVREASRVIAPGGGLLLVWSQGAKTPIWVGRRALERRAAACGLAVSAEGQAGEGCWVYVARR